jgi:GNAT superfamily N-acetyltransferase
MSFWASYQVFPTPKRFEEYRVPLDPIDTEGITIETYSPEIGRFLETHFGTTLRSRPPPMTGDEFVVARSRQGALLGCGHVVPHPPLFEGHRIYPTDWLCVSPAHRKTGLTSRILSVGYSYLRTKGIHTCLYLKEGAPMRITTPPLYSSTYVFRHTMPKQNSREGHLKTSLSPTQARRLMEIIRRVRPHTFLLHSEDLPNQTWRFWKKGLSWILMGFQDAYQSFKGESVGTLSAFFSGGPSSGSDFEAIVDSAPFDWIWTDQVFLKGGTTGGWSLDGPFHWYTYQWSTCLVLSDQYCLMV